MCYWFILIRVQVYITEELCANYSEIIVNFGSVAALKNLWFSLELFIPIHKEKYLNYSNTKNAVLAKYVMVGMGMSHSGS